MAQQISADDQVIDILLHTSMCDLEEVVHRCPDLTWNQVFLAVDRLSRNGKIVLMSGSRGTYTVTIPPRQGSQPGHHSLPS